MYRGILYPLEKNTMKDFWKTRQFWRTIALMIVASLLIVILTITSLRIFTRHGQAFVVPDLIGLTLDQVRSLEKEYRFSFIVIDSVFDQSHPPGAIIRHDPWPGSTVKRGRKFYVTLASSVQDMVRMPNLIDLSLRQATSLLQGAGLHVGTVTYRRDHEFQNAVLEQRYRGQRIAPGENVRRGSYINLVVSGTQGGGREDGQERRFGDNSIEFSDEY